MLTSLALIFSGGMLLGAVFTRLRLPGLLGMLITGIILGPRALNLIDGSILSASADLQKLALVIILIRAGLSLDLNDLKRVGRPAVLMCFVPACFEIAGMIGLAPKMMGISVLEAAILGSVVAAVSPAAIVPKMLELMAQGYGKDKSIPQLIMAGASVDGVFVIVLFTSFMSLAGGESLSAARFAEIPAAVLSGLVTGVVLGGLFSAFFKKVSVRDTTKVLILLSAAFLFFAVEKQGVIPFSGLPAVMALGIALLKFYPALAQKLASRFAELWVGAEILLFVLVGAALDMSYAVSTGADAALLVLMVVVFRMAGVFLCLWGSRLNGGERLFCMAAYIPKATVQAAIGGIPLAAGLSCGTLVLTVAVLSILITAPLGALGMDLLYKKCLKQS